MGAQPGARRKEDIVTQYDVVANPKHYHRDGVDFECVALSTLFPHPLASAVEYVFRYQEKNGVEDLKKAQWWIRYALNHPEIVADPIDSDTAYHMLIQLVQSLPQQTTERDFWGCMALYVNRGDFEPEALLTAADSVLNDMVHHNQ